MDTWIQVYNIEKIIKSICIGFCVCASGCVVRVLCRDYGPCIASCERVYSVVSQNVHAYKVIFLFLGLLLPVCTYRMSHEKVWLLPLPLLPLPFPLPIHSRRKHLYTWLL